MRKEPLWESAARSYIRAALMTGIWDFGLGLVRLPERGPDQEPATRECHTPHELRDYLQEFARRGWNACVPHDGERPEVAFEDFDTRSVIEEELAAHHAVMRLLGWDADEIENVRIAAA